MLTGNGILTQYVMFVLSNVDSTEDRSVPDVSLCQRCRRPSDGNYTCTAGSGRWCVTSRANVYIGKHIS